MQHRPSTRALTVLLAFALFLGALYLLHRELSRFDHRQIVAAARATPPGQILVALLLTGASYGLLTLYDVLGLRHAGRRLPYGRTALTSFASYVASHNLGLSGLGGTAVRYRLYTAFGLSAAEIAEVVAFCGLTFWIGLLLLAGVIFTAWPIELPSALHAFFRSTRPLGCLLLVPAAGFLVWTLAARRPLVVRGWRFEPPSRGLLLVQVPLAVIDWVLAAAVFHALLPHGYGLTFLQVLAVFLAAQTVGLVSHVPAGIGVFETLVLHLLPDSIPTPELVGALLVYRAVYYLLPLALGALLFLGAEVTLRRRALAALGTGLLPLGESLLPRVLALATAGAGTVLLLTGSLPTVGARTAWLRETLPLSAVEFSHFAGSLVGAGLLILARGLARRLDAAWWLTALLLAAGGGFALLRGLDYEEATLLLLLLALLLPFRRVFHRHASLLHQPLQADWWLAIGLVLGSSALLGFLAHRHMEYSHDLWWRFGYEADAPRFLRATAGAVALLSVFGLARLLSVVPPPQPLPGADDLRRVGEVLAREPGTFGHLALVGDKHLLFDEGGRAFLMYGIQRRSWIALGDPVAPDEPTARELIWRFRELAAHFGGRAAFYQVGPAHLGWYAEVGCALLKLGEEARVDLAAFSLAGGHHKGLRAAANRGEREGLAFEVVPAADAPAHLPALRGVSDRWLASKRAREKGFSLGFFDPAYLARGPLALVSLDGRPLAFANLELGARGGELSLDLMRHEPDAPGGLMDFLFVRLFEWGREQGFRWFSLGMAPLSGIESRPAAPVWNRIASLVAEHGERFYGFQGLRHYKEKFEPVWQPRYLATPGGLAVPAVLLDVSALISRGSAGAAGR